MKGNAFGSKPKFRRRNNNILTGVKISSVASHESFVCDSQTHPRNQSQPSPACQLDCQTKCLT